MGRFISFSKIGQLKSVVANIRKESKWYQTEEPTIKFHGTVKSHGTNAGVVFAPDGEYHIQSRKNVINLKKDNAGFAMFAEQHIESFKKFNKDIREANPELVDETLAFFGEWAGQGIQKGVAISEIPKFFIMFAVKVKAKVKAENGEEVGTYLTKDKWEMFKDEDSRIFNVNDFPSYDIEIDFKNPQLQVNTITDLVDQVETECPIGKRFGVKGVGEGIVWVGHSDNGTRYVFKTKGEKHSATKVKVLVPVDIEKVKGIQEFVDYALTENRLNQGIEQVFTSTSTEVSNKGTGNFLKWIVNDIIDEETETLVASGLEVKDVNKVLSKSARDWFFKYIDSTLGM
jgi:hypothetical protein